MSPLCFNLRSITRSMGNFQDAVLYMRQIGKMCTPGVNIDGSIVAGESRFCTVIGTIHDTDETLVRNITNMRCSRCGLIENMDMLHRAVVGEV